MASEVITTMVGLVLGLLTGFYFERRSNRSTEAQNHALRNELETLRATVYSLGGDPDAGVTGGNPPDLLAAVRTRAIATQDASGKVSRSQIVAYFVASGVSASDVDAALTDLSAAGFIEEEGRWIQIR